MDVFAFKGKRPVETTPLFRAPFFNVTGSSVCLGSSQFRETERYELRKSCCNTGKRILADGVLPLGRQRKPDSIKPCIGDESSQEQTFRPRRVKTIEQSET